MQARDCENRRLHSRQVNERNSDFAITVSGGVGLSQGSDVVDFLEHSCLLVTQNLRNLT